MYNKPPSASTLNSCRRSQTMKNSLTIAGTRCVFCRHCYEISTCTVFYNKISNYTALKNKRNIIVRQRYILLIVTYKTLQGLNVIFANPDKERSSSVNTLMSRSQGVSSRSRKRFCGSLYRASFEYARLLLTLHTLSKTIFSLDSG